MKKAVSLFVALVLLLCMSAFALRGSGYPAYDGSTSADNTLFGNFGSDALTLEFDGSADYSMVKDGVIQACFFAYDQSETNYIETYLEIPASVRSGDRFSSAPDMRGLSSSAAISFYEISADSETLFYAGSVIGIPYPDESLFDISIAEAQTGADYIEVRGTLTATLVRFNENKQPGQEKLQLDGVQFHFRLPVSGETAKPAPQEPAPAPDEAGKQPAPAPKPAFTLPPDYITL